MAKLNYTDQELSYWAQAVSKEFYEIIYDDPWFKEIFKSIKKEFITSQQADFALGALGGPKNYSGRSPADAHIHIFIDEEMWQYRENLLKQAFEKVNCPDDIRKQWLRVDEAFKKSMLMKNPNECQKRYATDELIIVPNPFKKSA